MNVKPKTNLYYFFTIKHCFIFLQFFNNSRGINVLVILYSVFLPKSPYKDTDFFFETQQGLRITDGFFQIGDSIGNLGAFIYIEESLIGNSETSYQVRLMF